MVLATNARKIQQMQLWCCRQFTSVLTIRLTQTLTSIWCMHWFRSYLEPLHWVVWCLCRLSLACRSSWCFHWAEKISVVDSMIWIHFHCSPTHWPCKQELNNYSSLEQHLQMQYRTMDQIFWFGTTTPNLVGGFWNGQGCPPKGLRSVPKSL